MATKRARTIGNITRKIPVEIVEPSFEVFKSVADLDVAKLERARSATVELGLLKSGCCQQVVRAVVTRGMVTGIELEPCRKDEAGGKPPADLVEAVKAAAKIARKVRRPGTWRPVPVARLAQSASALIESITCYRFCIWGHCITCCTTVSNQIVCTLGDVIIHGPIVIVLG